MITAIYLLGNSNSLFVVVLLFTARLPDVTRRLLLDVNVWIPEYTWPEVDSSSLPNYCGARGGVFLPIVNKYEQVR